mmetsp:Transcript_82542/g.256393  ORF Transcript_82542/g.256393 Transcript_82542/m.256393 type:complete len:260 (+) Transcript_82542:1226-2005(+)
MQWPKDRFVRKLGPASRGTASSVFSHHSRRPPSPASVFTSSAVVLPSLRRTFKLVSVGSRPRRKLWPSRAAFAACAVSPVAGSNSSREVEVHSSPLLAMAPHAAPVAAAGCATETPSSRTLLRPLTSPACSSLRLPSSKALATRPLNMAEEPVNWRRSTSRRASWRTAGSASGAMPGKTSRRPGGRPHSAMSLCTSKKWGRKRGCTTSRTRKPWSSMCTASFSARSAKLAGGVTKHSLPSPTRWISNWKSSLPCFRVAR